MSTIELVDEPLAPMEVIGEIQQDAILSIKPIFKSTKLYLDADPGYLPEWNKESSGSHVIGGGGGELEFLGDSLDVNLGLDNVGNWLAFQRPDRRIEAYFFDRSIKTLKIKEDSNEYLTLIEMGFKKGITISRAWIRYPDFIKDSNGDGIPNFVDKIDKIANKFSKTLKVWDFLTADLEQFITSDGQVFQVKR